jgi:Na+-translocating ferredoxin:NAD+ oxidoreductase RnfG subunit
MNAKRAFYLMIAAFGLTCLGLAALVYTGNKLLVKESDKLLELKAISQVLESQTTGLSQAKQDVQKYKGIEEITQAVVPQDKDQARAVREIVELARQSGIELKSITFPASNLGNTAKSQSGSTSAQTKAVTGLSQAKPVEGIKGVYSVELSIEPVGEVNYYQFLDFITKLENNRRTSQVSRIRIDQPANKDSQNIDFSLTLNIFVKP